ncbi:MAG: NDP-sugar synthase [Vulcanisaeta sp. AZ3]|jgi:NDP-sugar pyrophosphorylase family protein
MLKIVILTAGLGERLRPLTYLVPKPYLPLRDGLIIERILRWVWEQGLNYDEIIVVTAYMAERIISMLSGVLRGVKFIVADKLLGTAGQLWYVKNEVNDNDDVIIINGDIITNIPLSKALEFHKSSGADITIVSVKYKLTARYGVLDIGPNGEFKSWIEKPTITLPIVTGIYVMRGSFIRRLTEKKLDMNRYVESVQSTGGKVMVYISDYEYIDIGVLQDYLNALTKS